jgi:hypothetical protein
MAIFELNLLAAPGKLVWRLEGDTMDVWSERWRRNSMA